MSDTPPPPPPYGGGQQPTPPPPPPGYDPGVPGYGQQPYGAPPAYGQPGYGQPAFGAAPQSRTNGMAVASLVLGILGVPTFCLPLFSLLAVVFGAVGLNQCKKDASYSGRGLAIAGLVLGSLMLLVFIALIVVGQTIDPDTWNVGE